MYRFRRMYVWIDSSIDRPIDGSMDPGIDGSMDPWMDAWMDGWMDGWMCEVSLFQSSVNLLNCHCPIV